MNTWRHVASRRSVYMLLAALIAITVPVASKADRIKAPRVAVIQADAATSWDPEAKFKPYADLPKDAQKAEKAGEVRVRGCALGDTGNSCSKPSC